MMLSFMRRILGNSEKIAIGNKICIVLYALLCLICIRMWQESGGYAKIESEKMEVYNKVKADLDRIVAENEQDPEINALKVEIETLKTKLANAKKDSARYNEMLTNQRAAAAEKRAAQVKLEEEFKQQFSAWNGSHHKTVEYVKDRMHNPKSFKHVETHYIDHAEKGYRLIQMKYRGTNLFGAIVTNSIWVKVNLRGDVIEVIQTN